MKAKPVKEKQPKRRKSCEEKTGYGLSGFGLLIAFLTIYFQFCTTIQTTIRLTILSIGIALIGVGFTLVAKGIAEVSWKIAFDSDERMRAMANLEFYEKMAMIQVYITCMCQKGTDEYNKAYADRIFYDLKGAKQLEEWVKDPEIAKMLDDGIKTLIAKALAGQEHEHLIKRLQEAREDC